MTSGYLLVETYLKLLSSSSKVFPVDKLELLPCSTWLIENKVLKVFQGYLNYFKLSFTCSKPKIGILDKYFNFEHISHLFLVFLLLTLNK